MNESNRMENDMKCIKLKSLLNGKLIESSIHSKFAAKKGMEINRTKSRENMRLEKMPFNWPCCDEKRVKQIVNFMKMLMLTHTIYRARPRR